MGKGGKAPQRFALPQARVHQQARPGSFKQSAIARTARRENAHAKADGFSPKSFTQHARRGSAVSRSRHPAARGSNSKETSRPHASSQKRGAHVNGFEEFCDRKCQQASRSRFRWKPSRGPTTVAAILRGWKNPRAVCCTSSAVTASIEACNSSTVKKRPK